MSQEMFALRLVKPAHSVREDADFYIPDYLSAGAAGVRSAARSAAHRHASDLRDAERYLDEALNLVAVLAGSLQEAGDARAMQAETVLNVVESRLKQAHDCIDRHDTRFMNLFLAYFDLKDRAADSRDD